MCFFCCGRIWHYTLKVLLSCNQKLCSPVMYSVNVFLNFHASWDSQQAAKSQILENVGSDLLFFYHPLTGWTDMKVLVHSWLEFDCWKTSSHSSWWNVFVFFFFALTLCVQYLTQNSIEWVVDTVRHHLYPTYWNIITEMFIFIKFYLY